MLPLLAFSQSQQISLQHGVYVREPAACKEAPNAAMLIWDGNGFAGAHASKCKSSVLSQHGSKFQMSTTCSSLGDGAPDKSGYVEEFSLTRLSSKRFVMAKKDQPDGTYRWCAAK